MSLNLKLAKILRMASQDIGGWDSAKVQAVMAAICGQPLKKSISQLWDDFFKTIGTEVPMFGYPQVHHGEEESSELAEIGDQRREEQLRDIEAALKRGKPNFYTNPAVLLGEIRKRLRGRSIADLEKDPNFHRQVMKQLSDDWNVAKKAALFGFDIMKAAEEDPDGVVSISQMKLGIKRELWPVFDKALFHLDDMGVICLNPDNRIGQLAPEEIEMLSKDPKSGSYFMGFAKR